MSGTPGGPPGGDATGPRAAAAASRGAAVDVDAVAFKHCIAAEASISGRIHFPADARIDGRVKGEIRADALLFVGETAILDADVRAERLVLAGTIRGNLVALSRAELLPGARVVGSIAATALVARAGARIEGRCAIGRPVERTSASIREVRPAGADARAPRRGAAAG